MELASLDIRLSRSENLPVLPQAVSGVLRLADDPDASPRDIAQCIERDPAVTAKILRAANSAYYGFSNVNTVGKAISFLGVNSVRSLVVSVALQNMLAGKSLARSFNKTEYWKHCLAVGIASRVISAVALPSKSEEMFCAGMMHDVGLLVLDKFVGSEFEECLRRALHEGTPLEKLERDVIGFDHAEVGGILAQRWNLPKLIKHAILYHLKPELDGDYYETTCIVAVANAMAFDLGYDCGLPKCQPVVGRDVYKSVALPFDQYPSIREVVKVEVERAQAAFKVR